jgi:hypothetical protein
VIFFISLAHALTESILIVPLATAIWIHMDQDQDRRRKVLTGLRAQIWFLSVLKQQFQTKVIE